MSFYSDASLVMIPSGYKTSKVYCAVPTDGAADLAFTRSNDTATRVGPDGLIEKVRTNLFPYSQDFSTATWSMEGTMTETFSQTDPNGGTTGVLVTGGTSGNGYYFHNITCVANVPNTFSIYIKGNASGSVSIRIDDSTTGPQFNINYTTSWQRFSVTSTPDQTGCAFVVGGYSTWDIGENLSFAFAQAETGDIATDYIATTSAAVSVGPVANVPRLDYTDSTCPRLLLEPQRTNLITYSEQFDNAAWVKDQITISANTTISPDGYQNADTATIVTSGSNLVTQVISVSASTTYTFSFYVKRGTATDLRYSIYDVTNAANIVAPTAYYSQTSSSQWTRISFAFATPVGCISIACYPIRSATSTGTAFLYGCQVEEGAYATSYVGPTLGAAVTRGVDVAEKTGISSLIGQTVGTVFVEFEFSGLKDSYWPVMTVMGATSAEIIEIYGSAGSNAVEVNMFDGGVTQFSRTRALTVGRHKLAIAYELNNTVAYLDGTVMGGVDTLCTIPTMTQIALGKFSYSSGYTYGDRINQTILFPTRLSDSDLAALTA